MEKVKAFIEKHSILAFWIVIVIQICFVIFWGCMKSNFHQDELYSFESAHYINDSTPGNMYMHQTEMFEENIWLSVGDFKELLIIDNESSIFKDKPNRIMHKFFISRPYMVLLNIFTNAFSAGEISKWPGILLNIPCIIIMLCCLYKLMYGMTKNKNLALFTIVAYGFSSISLGFGVYTRFYCYTLMMLMLSIYLHFLIWINEKNTYRNVIFEIIALLCFVQAFRGSELCAVIAASWFISFSLGLLIKKRWKYFLIYVSPALVGAVYLINVFSQFREVFRNPAKYMDGSGQPLDLMFTNATNITKRQILRRTWNYFDFLGDSLFGSEIILGLLILTMIILFVFYIKRVKASKITLLDSVDKGFLYMIVAVSIIYSIFGFVVSLWLPRYYALIYPEILMIIVIIFWCLLKNIKKIYNYMVIGLFATGIVVTNLFARVDNVFIDDRQALANLQKYDVIDNVIWNMDDFQILMECAYQMPKDSQMYVCSEYEPLEFEDFGDEYLLWTCQSEPLTDEAIGDINSNGYEVVEYLGIAADANIYYCKKLN